MGRIAIFASGSGTNAENIIRYFNQKTDSPHRVVLVLTNKPHAGVIERSQQLKVPVKVFSREEFYQTQDLLTTLKTFSCNFIVLAGFLWLVPQYIIQAFNGRILNIHPALLPKYGGKGMYGQRVHQAVIDNGEKESGITIHRVNEYYDEGNIVFQATCPVEKSDTAETLAKKIHALEYEYFPSIIEQELENVL